MILAASSSSEEDAVFFVFLPEGGYSCYLNWMQQEAIREQYLLDYLREEFSAYPQVRIRALPKCQRPEASTGALEEDDEDSGSSEEGISLRTESREYFFPFEWAYRMQFDQVQKLVARIKDVLG